ncbi:MAG: SDR family NAD(P)-dependent oxidoreductase, partial [Ignavibacteriales bacterium]|nr:SDR family NAD(P)-dependent oxidoreductase [Ignavibacteriales bacterium]
MSDTKTILVTGATDGIGTETAKRLLEEGADVYLHGRSDEKLARTAEALEKETGKAPAGTFRANYASLSEVKQMADAILARLDRLHVLLNNAGVFMNERVETEDGNEATFQINHLAPFALTLKLLPLLKASAPSRIVNVASMAHQRA